MGSSFIHSLACRGISTDTPRRVVVTGIGWVTPMGNSVSGVYEKLLHGETGVRTIGTFDVANYLWQPVQS